MRVRFKKALSVLLAVMTALGSFVCISAFAATFRDNSHFKLVEPDKLVEMYESDEKFIAFIDGFDSISYSVGEEVLSTWMDEKGQDIYAMGVDPDGDGLEIPDFVFDALGDGFLYFPFVLFVDKKDINIFTGSVDGSFDYDAVTKAYNDFYPKEEKVTTGISIRNAPNKLLFLPGDKFDMTGLALNLEYSDGTHDPIYSGFTASEIDMETEGYKTVKITYGEYVTAYQINVSNMQDYTLSFKFNQEDARSMLKNINKLRTDSPWYWNEDDKTKTYPEISGVAYNYELEQAAMQRAVELIVAYSHTRPNGQRYSSVLSTTHGTIDENIAYGYQSAEDMFRGWEQADKNYEGQGHRRNMLDPDVVSVGIACAIYKDPDTETEVKFWVQLFSSEKSNMEQTTVPTGECTGDITILNTTILDVDESLSVESYDFEIEESAELPQVTAEIKVNQAKEFSYDFTYNVIPKCTWQSENSDVAKIESGKVIAGLPGTTNIYTTIGTKKIFVPVSVKTPEGDKVEYTPSVEKIEFNIGDSVLLPTVSAEITHSSGETETQNPVCTWETANDKIAKIDGGKVCGVAAGETEIFTSIDSSKISVPVKVSDYITQSNIGCGVTKAEIDLSKEYTLPTVTQENTYASGKTETAYPECVWSSENTEIAKIIENKKISAVGIGNTVVKTTVDGKNIEIAVTVNDYISKSEISCGISKAEVKVGSQYTLPKVSQKNTYASGKTETVYPECVWSSNNAKIASIVENKYISGISIGNTVVKTTVSGKSLEISVAVSGNESVKISIGGLTAGETKTVNTDFKPTVTFKAKLESVPEGAVVHWYTGGRDTGKTGNEFVLSAVQNETAVQAKLFVGSNAISESGIVTIKPNTGFFAKLIAFFRGLFGSLPKIDI